MRRLFAIRGYAAAAGPPRDCDEQFYSRGCDYGVCHGVLLPTVYDHRYEHRLGVSHVERVGVRGLYVIAYCWTSLHWRADWLFNEMMFTDRQFGFSLGPRDDPVVDARGRITRFPILEVSVSPKPCEPLRTKCELVYPVELNDHLTKRLEEIVRDEQHNRNQHTDQGAGAGIEVTGR